MAAKLRPSGNTTLLMGAYKLTRRNGPYPSSTLGSTFIMACCLTLASLSASASVVTLTGEDLNAGPGSAHPHSTAAASNFYSAASALGTVSKITFESAPTDHSRPSRSLPTIRSAERITLVQASKYSTRPPIQAHLRSMGSTRLLAAHSMSSSKAARLCSTLQTQPSSSEPISRVFRPASIRTSSLF